jgi:hypothetical protein
MSNELNVPLEFRDLFKVDDIADDVSLPDRSVTTDLSNYAVPADGSVGSILKGDGLNKNTVADESWDAPMTATFSPERSKKRFEKACASIKKVFGDSPEYDQAIALAKEMLDEARAEILAGVASPETKEKSK